MTKRQKIKATVYDKRGRVLSVGFNSYDKTHPIQALYARSVGLPEKVFLHAEIDALRKIRDVSRVYKIVVERYNSKGEPVIAKPCQICQRAIEDFGVKKVEHT